MGQYVSGNLMSDERIAYEFKWHWLYYVAPTIASLLLIGIPWLIIRILRAWSSELCITDHRLVGKVGLIARHAIDVPLDQVSSIQIDQGFIERILNAGTLRFKNDGEVVKVPISIADPRTGRNIFNETQLKFKKSLYTK